MKLLLKIIGVLVICVALVLAYFAFNLFFNKRKPDITLIPDGYVGPVVIRFGGKDSVPPQYENGIRVYTVPPAGILREQVPVSSPWESAVRDVDDDRFFYVKADGSRIRLPLVISWYGNFRDRMSEDERNRVSVYGITHGSKSVRYSATEWGSSKTEYFVSFVVGRVSDYETLIKQRDAAIERSGS